VVDVERPLEVGDEVQLVVDVECPLDLSRCHHSVPSKLQWGLGLYPSNQATSAGRWREIKREKPRGEG
jgi:hypothetical protein